MRPSVKLLLRLFSGGVGALASLPPANAYADDFVMITPTKPAAPPPAVPAVGVPAPAWPACGDDIVVLHDGGMIRGVIAELLPRNHVTLKLTTGKVVTVPWAEVHHIEQGGPVGRTCGTAAAPAVAPAVPSTASAALDDTGTLTLVVPESGYTLEVQRGTEWEEVCSSPCERVVPRDGFYRITGSGIQTSTNFRALGRPGTRVVLHVNPGSSALFGLGVVGVTIGGAAAVIGYISLPTMAYRNVSWPLPTMLVGGAASIVSAILVETNVKTKVGQEAHESELPTTDHPSIRVAPSKEARNVEPRGPGFSVPLLSGHF